MQGPRGTLLRRNRGAGGPWERGRGRGRPCSASNLHSHLAAALQHGLLAPPAAQRRQEALQGQWGQGLAHHARQRLHLAAVEGQAGLAARPLGRLPQQGRQHLGSLQAGAGHGQAPPLVLEQGARLVWEERNAGSHDDTRRGVPQGWGLCAQPRETQAFPGELARCAALPPPSGGATCRPDATRSPCAHPAPGSQAPPAGGQAVGAERRAGRGRQLPPHLSAAPLPPPLRVVPPPRPRPQAGMAGRRRTGPSHPQIWALRGGLARCTRAGGAHMRCTVRPTLGLRWRRWAAS